MKITDADLDKFTENEFVFDTPISFNTEAFTEKKAKDLKKVIEQLERAEKILTEKKDDRVVNIINQLTKTRNDLLNGDSELKIYPISMKDYVEFHNNIGYFMIEKNVPELYGSIEDYAKAISVPYLDFIIEYTGATEDQSLLQGCLKIMQLALQIKIDKIDFDMKSNHYILILNDKFYFSKDDFDALRKVVVYENLDIKINDFKNDAQREKEKVDKLRNESVDTPSLEAQVTAYCVGRNCSKSDVMKISLRTFRTELAMMISKEQYDLTSIGLMSGNIMMKSGTKTDFEHYLYKKKKNPDSLEENGFVPQETMVKKIKG